MRTFVLMVVVLGSTAFAADPPDVVHGERYDGRKPPPKGAKQLLVVPRVILAVPRLLMKGIGAIAKPVMEYGERNHVVEYLTAAFTSKDGLIGVRPVLEFELGFKPSGGVLYFNDRLPHEAKLAVSTAIGGIHVFSQKAEVSVPLGHHKLELTFHADFIRRDEELFTGIGMSKLALARYAFDQGDAKLALSYLPLTTLRIVAGIDFGIRRFGNGVDYSNDRSIDEVYCQITAGKCGSAQVDERRVPGFTHGTQFLRERIELHIDSRKTEETAGFMTDVGIEYTHGLGDDNSSYLRLKGHVGAAIELWKHRDLYIGFTAEDEIAFGATPIPFSELIPLGGAEDLRGFRRGAFRDASSMLATLEYRWPVWMWMDGSLFFDYGGVFGPRFSGFAFGDLRPDIGIGFRVHSGGKFIIRVQAAYGFGDQGGFRLVIAGNGNPA